MNKLLRFAVLVVVILSLAAPQAPAFAQDRPECVPGATAEAPPAKLYPAGDGAFEFERTVSRLMEMQSHEYLARAHRA